MESSSRHWIFIFLLFSLLLSGCIHRDCPCYCCPYRCPEPSTCPQPPVEVPPTCTCCEIIEELEKWDVQAIVIGDTVRIVLETDMFIIPSSNLVDPTYDKLFLLIACLIKCYPCICPTIYVVGYTDNVGSTLDKLRRSCVQAHSVAAYLWAHGIPLARMKIIGMGDFEPVAGNKTMIGSASNRRIEIFVNYVDWHVRP